MKTLTTILFDLDDTLLGNSMEHFIPQYFALLADYARPVLDDTRRFLQLLLAGTQAMIQNTDPTQSNRDVFWQYFQAHTGLDPAGTEQFFDDFYRDVFPRLQPVTQPRPEAIALVHDCLAHELQVVVATNPLFPRRAIEHRLAWAGLPVSEVPFALVTTYENMHAAKPQPAYYQEILAQVGARPGQAIMVGDDWKNDIAPAAQVGLGVYWMNPAGEAPPDNTPLIGQGDLTNLRQWLTQRPPFAPTTAQP